MAKIIPKVGDIWTVVRERYLFDHLKKGQVFYNSGYRLEIMKKEYCGSEMDCNDLVILTLRRLTDEVPEKAQKETFITYLKKCFKQLFKNNNKQNNGNTRTN
jgi:hypothetical protein|nr:MAG TPA: hypothetical protein [Caudoviricetes sp.]